MILLKLLFTKHKLWLSYIISFGCSKDIAEDYVQNMYLKVYEKYNGEKQNDIMFNDNEVNNYFVFVMLKNMYIDDQRKNKKYIKIDVSFIVELQAFTEVDLQKEVELNELNNSQKKALLLWENNIKVQIKKIDNYSKDKCNLEYILWIYNSILINKKSITELSDETRISYWSIRNTVNIIKNQIKKIQNDIERKSRNIDQ